MTLPMPKSPRRRLARLAHHQDGSVAVEFALTGTALLTLLLVLMEGAGMLLAQGMIDGAVNRAGRIGMTGTGGDFADRRALVEQAVTTRTAGLLDADRLAFHTLAYPSAADVGTFESYFDANRNGVLDGGEAFDDRNGDGVHQTDGARQDPGGSGELVIYQVSYRWSGLTPLISGTIGEVVLRSSVPVLNENF